jgi:hypothetical protein
LLRGREHARVGTRLAIVAGALVVALGVAGWFFFLRADAPFGGRPAPAFSFQLGKVNSVDLDRASPKGLEAAAKQLRSTLDAMYTAGFVDPDKWEDGTFPEVLEAFAMDASEVAGRDLADLTLGPASSQVEFVDPDRSRLAVKFLVGQEGRPYAALAAATFRATGELANGGTLGITHEGRYIMRPIDGRWMIVGYTVDGRLQPRKPSPSSGGTGGSS